MIALCFVLIYKTTEIINFAQGELMTFGGFVSLSLITSGLNFLLVVPITLFISFVFGMLLERAIFRRLIGEAPFSLIMVTLGLSIGMKSAIGMIWSYDIVSYPTIFSQKPLLMMGIPVSPLQMGIIVSTILAVLLFYIFFKYTRLGTAMQATAQNQLGAYLMGINVEKMFNLVWGISCSMSALAGILVAPVIFLDFNMGVIAIKAFPAMVLGGLESIPGAIVGGLIIGLSESMAGTYLHPGLKEVFPYLILFLILIIRPEGIFGIKEMKKV
jgi:branched-chain amino acid transport system permease protein